MTPAEPVHGPADCVDTWLSAALADPEDAGHGAARSAVFDALESIRGRDTPQDGAASRIARGFLTMAEDSRADVRYAVLSLLFEAAWGRGVWPAAVEVALPRLGDADERVRRCAAWVLAYADRHRAAALLDDGARELDAVARLSVVEALATRVRYRRAGFLVALAERLRSDADPAVRLAAALGALRSEPAGRGAEWEARALRDLEAGGGRMAGAGSPLDYLPGETLGLALRDGGTLDGSCALVESLASRRGEVSRRAAVDVARTVMRHWRAAPDRLSGVLARLLAEGSGTVRDQAADALGASYASARAGRDALASLLDRGPGADVPQTVRDGAATALLRIGDPRGVPTVCEALAAGRLLGHRFDGLGRPADPAADRSPLVGAARAQLVSHGTSCGHRAARRFCPAVQAVAALRLAGAAAAPAVPELAAWLDALTRTGDRRRGHDRTRLVLALGDIGPAAAAAVPLLESLLDIPAAGDRPAPARYLATALVRITGERQRAEAYLEGLAGSSRDSAAAVDLLEWLADHGGLTDRQVADLWTMASSPRSADLRVWGLLWRYDPERARDRILDTLPGYLDDDTCGPYACEVLGRMGAAAEAVLGRLAELADRPVRLRVYLGDADAEMRAEETLAESFAAARSAIARALGR
ncbi:hypothetical protein [Streptomyces sp. NPDC049040]|uniref:hypothetical protein n=1 Tax=Streptomyces sp. NPDC049040 TaxID=3365593 RepID=UPI00371D6D0B